MKKAWWFLTNVLPPAVLLASMFGLFIYVPAWMLWHREFRGLIFYAGLLYVAWAGAYLVPRTVRQLWTWMYGADE